MSEAAEIMRVASRATPHSAKAMAAGTGTNPNAMPSPVAMPLPPRNFKKQENVWPITAIRAQPAIGQYAIGPARARPINGAANPWRHQE